MYNIKGPSKIVAKSTRRGISQNIDGYRDSTKNGKPPTTNDNDFQGEPKPIFHSNPRNLLSNNVRQVELTPQHEELIKYIQGSWLSVSSTNNRRPSQTSTIKCRGDATVHFYEDEPCPHLQNFKPFDLESWWGKRLYNIITNSVNTRNKENALNK